MIEGCRGAAGHIPVNWDEVPQNNPPCKLGFGPCAQAASSRDDGGHAGFAQLAAPQVVRAAPARDRAGGRKGRLTVRAGPAADCRCVQDAELGCAPSHRCRWAHSKTALAFEQPPTSFIGQFPSSVEPASHVPPGADTAAAGRASAAERDRERYACELRVLRRTIPELEEALASRDSLLQAPPPL